MVAISASKPQFTGIRPFDPARDLFGVGRLLEEAFRPDRNFPLSNVPFLREAGIFLWTLGFAPIYPERVAGFVWIEDGRIVGNVTLTPDAGRLDRHFISNVAVKPEFQRRGIARTMMQAVLTDLRERRANWALLNVRPNNADALALYRDLGFDQVEMTGEWVLTSPHSPNPLSPLLTEPRQERGEGAKRVRALRLSDHLSVKELLRAATPERISQFRSPHLSPFSISWDDRAIEMISDFFIGQTTRRWGVEQDGKLIATLVLQAQRGPFPHRLAALVHPGARGEIERELLTLALRELRGFPRRDIRAAVTSAHPEWNAALEQAGFTFASGLTLMALAL